MVVFRFFSFVILTCVFSQASYSAAVDSKFPKLDFQVKDPLAICNILLQRAAMIEKQLASKRQGRHDNHALHSLRQATIEASQARIEQISRMQKGDLWNSFGSVLEDPQNSVEESHTVEGAIEILEKLPPFDFSQLKIRYSHPVSKLSELTWVETPDNWGYQFKKVPYQRFIDSADSQHPIEQITATNIGLLTFIYKYRVVIDAVLISTAKLGTGTVLDRDEATSKRARPPLYRYFTSIIEPNAIRDLDETSEEDLELTMNFVMVTSEKFPDPIDQLFYKSGLQNRVRFTPIRDQTLAVYATLPKAALVDLIDYGIEWGLVETINRVPTNLTISKHEEIPLSVYEGIDYFWEFLPNGISSVRLQFRKPVSHEKLFKWQKEYEEYHLLFRDRGSLVHRGVPSVFIAPTINRTIAKFISDHAREIEVVFLNSGTTSMQLEIPDPNGPRHLYGPPAFYASGRVDPALAKQLMGILFKEKPDQLVDVTLQLGKSSYLTDPFRQIFVDKGYLEQFEVTQTNATKRGNIVVRAKIPANLLSDVLDYTIFQGILRKASF